MRSSALQNSVMECSGIDALRLMRSLSFPAGTVGVRIGRTLNSSFSNRLDNSTVATGSPIRNGVMWLGSDGPAEGAIRDMQLNTSVDICCRYSLSLSIPVICPITKLVQAQVNGGRAVENMRLRDRLTAYSRISSESMANAPIEAAALPNVPTITSISSGADESMHSPRPFAPHTPKAWASSTYNMVFGWRRLIPIRASMSALSPSML